HPHGNTPLIPHAVSTSTDTRLLGERRDSGPHAPHPEQVSPSENKGRPRNVRAISSYHTARYSISDSEEIGPSPRPSRSNTMSSMDSARSTRPPNVKLQYDGVTEEFLDDHFGQASSEAATAVNQPKSPGGRFTSLFGWSKTPGAEPPSTTFSDRSMSPEPSLLRAEATTGELWPSNKHAPASLDVKKANASSQQSYFNLPGTPLLSSSTGMNAHVEELECQLKELSSQLATSIRREMELEDEVERLNMEGLQSISEVNRRTSDYYSDSGASSVRQHLGDSDTKIEALERLRRKAEQEMAQLKVDTAERLQQELRRRRDLEARVQALEEKLESRDSIQAEISEDAEQVRGLEAALDDTRRRLSEERQFKENFEEMLAAMRQELQEYRDERDNLREEVVPQLQARVEGLEAEAIDTQALTYENSRMQQQIQSLQHENHSLANALRSQQDSAQQSSRIDSHHEGSETLPPLKSPRIGLSRSNSLARTSILGLKRLSRSNSIKEKNSLTQSGSLKEKVDRLEPRDALHDRTKDIEDQRDALHRALRCLLQRHGYQAREHAKHIKVLEMERDRALNATPRRTAFNKEVTHLRDEVNHLRRRANDALEQKWQCEKGLSGLRMDLDRAEQETSSLRDLLQERDIFVPERKASTSSITELDTGNTSASLSLDKAYKELQTTHALSLARIRYMEEEGPLGETSAEAERTLDLLRQSISDAEVERGFARREAEEYRQQARSLQQSELAHLGKEQSLAAELYASAARMDELASQVQQQLHSNRLLRQRLADAIGRGEREQKSSAAKIVDMQGKLKSLEEKVMVAQQHSEEMVSRHEEELKDVQDSHNMQLQRMKNGLLSPSKLSPSTPLSPLFALRQPRLHKTTSGFGQSMAEATKTELLEQRVEDLEKALRDADHEMQEVVSRMNIAQIEVAELQAEKDEAMRRTRRLQAEMLAEREKVRALAC
ncbi:hypothetical protein H2201_002455, partial [Coniosporium apollinis]